jgi:hypothetical protein
MANVQSSNGLALRRQLRGAAAGRNQGAPGPTRDLLQALAVAGRKLVGAVFLLLGILMMSTLLLLPVGLPLALLAVALLAAPGRRAGVPDSAPECPRPAGIYRGVSAQRGGGSASWKR